MADDTEGVADEANRLYWNSDMSVADIAAQLELSRRALYAAVRPEPTGEACGDCGGALTWPNRSARDGGRSECGACEGGEETAATGDRPTERRSGADRRAGASSLQRRAVQLGGAALVGAIVAAGVTVIATRD